jgi:FkbM family methyltransferase
MSGGFKIMFDFPELDKSSVDETSWILKQVKNWRDLVNSIKNNRTLPPLYLMNGLTIFHEELTEDEILFIFKRIFIENSYTKDHFYQPESSHTIIDIGANIGLFTLFCQSQARGSRIHCFEPTPLTQRCLEKNIIFNQLEEVVKIYPYAVSDRSTLKQLRSATKYSTARSFFKYYTTNFGDLTTDEYTDTVQVISLDEVLKIVNTGIVDFLKIDAEGSEVEILTGASEDGLKKINKIALEYHDAIRPNCSEILINTLARNGFSNIVIEPLAKFPGHGIIRAKR